MTASNTLVVGFSDKAQEQFRSVLVPLTRTRSKALIALAAISTVMILLPYLTLMMLVGFSPRSFVLLALLVFPAAMLALAIRRLRKPPVLNPPALTITPTQVVFEERESPGLIPITRPAAAWPLTDTKVQIIPANRLLPARLEFRCTQPRQRRHSFGIDMLDTPAQTIIAAIENAGMNSDGCVTVGDL
jgi:hypothetical protein